MATDALTLLRTDHRTVDTLFDQFAAGQGETMAIGKAELAHKICAELKVHTRIEEEIFYPAIRKALPDAADLLDEAIDEHAEAKEQISRIEACGPADGKALSGLVGQLAEMIRCHVKEEEGAMFPRVARSSIDVAEIGRRMEHRKLQLKAAAAAPPAMRDATRQGMPRR